jgi:diketogulonate reductase-like aldo/keto reductase
MMMPDEIKKEDAVRNKMHHINALADAVVEDGIRHLDMALTGNVSLCSIGAALRMVFEQNEIKREDMFLSCKVYPTEGNYAIKESVMGNELAKAVEQQVDEAVRELKIESLDLVLLQGAGRVDGTEEGNTSRRF